MSLDGYIDDTSDQRLILSNEADFDRVDELRASCDATLIGANTIRRDNPRLLVNSEERRRDRVARGMAPYPIKITVTRGNLQSEWKFFNTGGEKIIYCPGVAADELREKLGGRATVVGLGAQSVDIELMLADLRQRGIDRLMVEGGSSIHTEFLTRGLAHELQIAIAPFFVGEDSAPRFVNSGMFRQNSTNRMTLAEVRQIGDIVFARYLTKR
ncbi:MAG: dihydrofolate reductase family protein [Actinomycetota bacterium]|nr:dihydrofolate reductase family protein [Actinomycetota bacterium]